MRYSCIGIHLSSLRKSSPPLLNLDGNDIAKPISHTAYDTEPNRSLASVVTNLHPRTLPPPPPVMERALSKSVTPVVHSNLLPFLQLSHQLNNLAVRGPPHTNHNHSSRQANKLESLIYQQGVVSAARDAYLSPQLTGSRSANNNPWKNNYPGTVGRQATGSGARRASSSTNLSPPPPPNRHTPSRSEDLSSLRPPIVKV
ncbi:hypothetical protein JAAARDRAFT_196609 [Jaapia argillacea MUCL 33604]|uniref:Uncharacterized protein n=1 Tax=Jaapia argillacea MUCL 33604 TaxID=933084 RepID=A0A067PV66_9AGAM|nr:hypothetical protein JAAARDRAFT_196609 [Jaapia argillacea MUCL 33604]